MSKKKPNVRSFELGVGSSVPPSDPSVPVDMPVREQYSESEMQRKPKRFNVSFCVDDPVLKQLGWQKLLEGFAAVHEGNLVSVCTSIDSKLTGWCIAIITESYLNSPRCIDELKAISSKANLLLGITLLFWRDIDIINDKTEFPLKSMMKMGGVEKMVFHNHQELRSALDLHVERDSKPRSP